MSEYADFAPLVLKLLRGPIYYDDPLWSELLVQQRKTAEYLARIGLELVLSESDGRLRVPEPAGRPRKRVPSSPDGPESPLLRGFPAGDSVAGRA